MAVHNGMPYLPLAIESILSQTYEDFEFLIVNDRSTDETRDVVLGYCDSRIRLIDNQENIGQTRSLNRGLSETRCELVARMDDDDVSHPQRLERQVRFLEEHSEVAVVGSNLTFIDAGGQEIGGWTYPEHDLALRWLQLFACPVSNGAAMFRRDVVWDKLGGYDGEIAISQDWELWGRVLVGDKLANLPESLLQVRRHPNQETLVRQEAMWRELSKISRRNPRLIIEGIGESEEWLSKAELLPHDAHQARRRCPREFLEMVEELYLKFCERYPDATEDQGVRRELASQYFAAADSCAPWHLPTALRALWKAKHTSPMRMFVYRLLRWPAMSLGAKQAEAWLLQRPRLHAWIGQVQAWVLGIRRGVAQGSIQPSRHDAP
jgi:glycosyltransferase involved in cell wall biosynthesis